MPDDAQIKVTTPGAAQAKRSLEGVAAAEKKVGREGKAAGDKTKKGADDAKQAVDQLGRSVGLNVSALANWKVAAAAAVAALVQGLRKSIEYMNTLRKEFRQTYREFVDLTRQPKTVQLAQLRGKTEAETVKWMFETAEEYAISKESARDMAFEIESGLAPEAVGGAKAREDIEQAGFKFMRVTGATGEATAGLAIAGYEAGIAARPEEFRALYAKISKSTKGARVSEQQITEVLSALLPMAVANGIDPNYFIAMTCAMSFRIGNPGRLRTSLERLIRAAGQRGPALESYAEKMGRDVTDLGAVEVMEFHSRMLSAAMRRGGPQAAAVVAEQLGLAGEMVTTYAAAFDPSVQARMRGIMGPGGRADWEAVIGGRYRRVRGEPESQVYAARMGRKRREFVSSREHWLMTELEDYAKGEVTRMMAEGEDIPGVLESMPKGRGRAERRLLVLELLKIIKEASKTEGVSVEDRAGFEALGQVVREVGLSEYQQFGVSEGFIQRAAVAVQNYYYGGTQNINQDRRDPAGRPRPARAKY